MTIFPGMSFNVNDFSGLSSFTVAAGIFSPGLISAFAKSDAAAEWAAWVALASSEVISEDTLEGVGTWQSSHWRGSMWMLVDLHMTPCTWSYYAALFRSSIEYLQYIILLQNSWHGRWCNRKFVSILIMFTPATQWRRVTISRSANPERRSKGNGDIDIRIWSSLLRKYI